MKAFSRPAAAILTVPMLLRWAMLLLASLAVQLPAFAQLPAIASPRLDHTELALEVGASSAVSVVLPGPASVAQTYTVTTTRPDLLQAPTRVTLAAGASSIAVPIQALGPGVGLVRIVGNTRQLAATVRVIDAGQAGLQSVEPLPATVQQGGTAQLRVELSAVPRDDVLIALSADAPDVVRVPTLVVVPAGQRSAVVAVQALTQGAHALHADLGTQRLQALLRVTQAAGAVQAMHPSHSEVEVGASVSVDVLLNEFSSTPIEVTLAATPTDRLGHPAKVQVPAGADRVSVSFKGLRKGPVVVTAEGGGRSASSTVVVRDPVGAAVPPVLNLRPPLLAVGVGATATIQVEIDGVRASDQVLTLALAQQQPSGGGTAAVLVVPASLTVPAGQRSASFQIAGAASGTARVSVRASNSTALNYLDVTVTDRPSRITALTPTQQSLPKGTVGQVQLSIAPHNATHSAATLDVDAAEVIALPQRVDIAPGQGQASVPIVARAEGHAQITATLNGSSATAGIIVTPPAVEELRPPKTFTLSVGSIQRMPVTALLTDGLIDEAPAGLQLPISDKPEVVSVEADGRLNGKSVGQALVTLRLESIKLVVPVTVVQPPSLSLNPAAAQVTVGESLGYTLATSSPAPAGGLAVSLSYSGEGGLELPSSVLIAAGASSAPFAVKALSAGAVTLRAEAPGRQPATASLVKLQPTLTITSISPLRGPAGTAVTIAGAGFDAESPANNRVYIGEVALELASATRTQLLVRVPINAVTGAVRVVNALGEARGDVFTVQQSQDANLTVTPNSLRLLRGSESMAAIAIANLGTQPYTGTMELSVSGLPTGVTARFSPQNLPAERSGTLQLSATGVVAPGSYALVVTGVGNSSAGRITRTAAVTLTIPDPETTPSTGVRGRFVTPEGQPIASVVVRADVGAQTSPVTATDASGSFEIAGLGAGPVTLRFDATPANPLYPIWPFSVNIVAGQMTVLKDFVIAPPPPAQNFSAINNAAQDQKIVDQRFPGLEVLLPAGTEIIGWDGIKKTQIAVEKREISELPVVAPPVPTGAAFQLYFGTPMGGIPSKPVPISLPNDTGAGPGETVNVWFFDGSPMGGTGEWKVAGQAEISADGKVAKMVNGGLTRFCGVCGLACLQSNPPGDDPGNGCPKSQGGNPVNLFSGQELTQTGGMSCTGLVPIETGRNYNPIDAFGNIGGTEGSIGYGWALDYDVMFLGGATKRLVMPGNVGHVFGDEGGGNYRNRTEPRFDGAIAREVSGGWQITNKDGSVWKFQPFAGAPGNVRGQPNFLVEVRDLNGRVITVSRNTRGQLLSVGTEERRISASYGSSGFIEALTDPEGRAERYTYTSSKRIETVTDPDGRITRYGYVRDADLPTDGACSFAQRTETGERLKTISYPGLANPTENHYGSSRRILRQTTATGLEYRFSYRVGGACVTNTATPGVPCSAGNCPTEDNWSNYQAGWRFHGGQVLATTVNQPDGTTTVTRFGSVGQVLESSDSAGDRTQYQRDVNNRVLRTTDALGRVSRTSYDDIGNVTRTIDPLGRATDFTYDLRWSYPATITRLDDQGVAQVWRLAYDTKGNLVETVNPLGHKTVMGYSALGQLTSVTDPLNQMSRFAYNAAGDPIRSTDPLNNAMVMGTDRSGRQTALTDALGYTTHVQTNGIGLPSQIEDAIGGKTILAYDNGARLMSITNPRGHVVASYAYDVAGRLSTQTDAAGRSDSLEYDAAGRLERSVDRKGQATRYVYDSSSRVSRVELPDRTRNITYDAVGRVVSVEESGSRVDYEYDAADRITKEVQTNGATSHVMTYGYDRLDRRIWRRIDGGNETRYEWDLADRLTAIRYAGESTIYQWDAAGRLQRKTLPNGVTADHGYDSANRLLSLTYRRADGTQVEKIEYSYDARGMRTRKALASGGVVADTPMTATYDAADRMASITFTASNETCALSYDVNGNMASKDCGAGKVTNYSWDGLNRLQEVVAPGLAASFKYDALGRRTSRVVNGVTTSYVYDGHQAVIEVTAADATQLLTGLGVDEAIATYSLGKQRYLLTDALGSVVADLAQNGSVVRRTSYSSYGDSIASGEVRSSSNAYTAREEDGTGLIYYRARYYNPHLKRFLSEDPTGMEDGLNVYAYVSGDPVNLTDPTGEFGIAGIFIGAGFEIGIQMMTNYMKGCDIWDIDNYDLWDIAASAAVGAVAPGWLAVGKKSLNSGRAARELTRQLAGARSPARIAKLNQRINSHKGQIKAIVGTQLAFQGAKGLGKALNGSVDRECECKK